MRFSALKPRAKIGFAPPDQPKGAGLISKAEEESSAETDPEPGDSTPAQGKGENSKESDSTDRAAEPIKPKQLRRVVEALLFASVEPLSLRQLRRLHPEAKKRELEQSIEELKSHYRPRGLELVEESGGYRFLTSQDLYEYVRRLRGNAKKLRLSKAAFETLAVIAYRQPVRRADLDSLRGVQSGAILKNLIEWNLVEVAGRDEASLGKPLLYRTTDYFLECFGLGSTTELPNLKAFRELSSDQLKLSAGSSPEESTSTEAPEVEITSESPSAAPAADSKRVDNADSSSPPATEDR